MAQETTIEHPILGVYETDQPSTLQWVGSAGVLADVLMRFLASDGGSITIRGGYGADLILRKNDEQIFFSVRRR